MVVFVSESEKSEDLTVASDRGREAADTALRPGDFYMENGFLVFTEAYHLRRGYCCNSGCRHCPYR